MLDAYGQIILLDWSSVAMTFGVARSNGGELKKISASRLIARLWKF
ncbi:hypothetical protein AEYBE204_06855 [Asticcacaulis sp. YBE204]|nr:hypothetical protein AEYBE204_06855 [Asticcacaulis sp. YBE204]